MKDVLEKGEMYGDEKVKSTFREKQILVFLEQSLCRGVVYSFQVKNIKREQKEERKHEEGKKK